MFKILFHISVIPLFVIGAGAQSGTGRDSISQYTSGYGQLNSSVPVYGNVYLVVVEVKDLKVAEDVLNRLARKYSALPQRDSGYFQTIYFEGQKKFQTLGLDFTATGLNAKVFARKAHSLEVIQKPLLL
jgi:hypothetical protein